MSTFSGEDMTLKGDFSSFTNTCSTTPLQQGSLYKDDTEGADNEYRMKKRSMLDELLLSAPVQTITSTRRKVLAAFAISLVSILAFVLAYLCLSSRSLSTEPAGSVDRTEECGRSAPEAISRGCTFDQLSMLCLPPEASRLGTAQFRERGGAEGWQYWSDRAGQHKITSISMHTGLYWTTEREHLAHCAYHFLRVSDALRGKVLYEWKTYQQEHNKHCAMMLLNASMQAPASGLDVITTSSNIGFGSASPVDW